MVFFTSRPLRLFNFVNITKMSNKNIFSQMVLTNTLQILEGRRILSHSVRNCRVNLNVQAPKPCYIGIRKYRFHTSSQQQAVPPSVFKVVERLSTIGVKITRRMARIWIRSRPNVERISYRRWIAFGWLGSLLIGVAYYNSHIQEAPVTKRKRFITLTQEQMLKVYQDKANALREKFKNQIVSTTDPQYQNIDAIKKNLVMSNQDLPMMKSQKWIITLVKSDIENGFVLPTGDIFVFTGLLEVATNDDQLAVFLGHEMAHVVLSHTAEKISFSQLTDFFIIALMAAIWTLMPNDGIAIVTQWFSKKVMNLIVHMPYSRQLEKEADQVGLEFAAKACYDVRQGSVFWSKMEMMSKWNQENNIELLSTHPAHHKRVQHINELIPQLLEKMKDRKCPPPSQRDPRDEIALVQERVRDIIKAI